jgi:hypothetical protein
MTLRIGTDEAALAIMKPGAANRTKLPPLLGSLEVLFRQIGLVHNHLRGVDPIGGDFLVVKEIVKVDKPFLIARGER